MSEITHSHVAVSATKPLLGVLVAEWVKFWTLRSNRVLAIIAVLFAPMNALLLTTSLRQRADDPDVSFLIPSVEPVAFIDSVLWLQLLITVIAVLFATSEHGGHLGISFLATPTRIPVAFAKAIVIGSIAFSIGTIGAAAGLLLPLSTLAGSIVTYSVTGVEIIGLSLGSGAYLAGIALVSFGLAVLLRNLVVAVLTPIALFTIVPAVLEWAGGETVATITGFFPSVAGRTAISTMSNPAGLDATTGLLTLGAWAAAAVVGAALAYRYRDA